MDLTCTPPTSDSFCQIDSAAGEHVSDYINTGMVMGAPGFLDTFVATLESLLEDVVVDEQVADEDKKGKVLDMDGCVQLFEWGCYEPPLFYFGGSMDENEKSAKERLRNEVLVAFASVVVGVSCEEEITRVFLETLKVGRKFGAENVQSWNNVSELQQRHVDGKEMLVDKVEVLDGKEMQIDHAKVPDERDEEDEDVVVV